MNLIDNVISSFRYLPLKHRGRGIDLSDPDMRFGACLSSVIRVEISSAYSYGVDCQTYRFSICWSALMSSSSPWLWVSMLARRVHHCQTKLLEFASFAMHFAIARCQCPARRSKGPYCACGDMRTTESPLTKSISLFFLTVCRCQCPREGCE